MYQCDDCSFSAKSKAGLVAHRRRKHPVTDEIPHTVVVETTAADIIPMNVQQDAMEKDQMGRIALYKTDAERLSENNGHSLGPWRDEDRWSHCKCIVCRAPAAVALAPASGNQFISGAATTEKCVP